MGEHYKLSKGHQFQERQIKKVPYGLATCLLHVLYEDHSLLKNISDKIERTDTILSEYIQIEQYWTFPKNTPELMVLFDFQHVW